MHLWWSGDLPDDDRLFDELTADADVTIVHSADMDLRDLEQLRRIDGLGDVRIEAGLTAECEAYLGTLSRLARPA